jgi:putative flippase GtrA
MSFNRFLKNFLIPKIKFGMTSIIATAVDHIIYLVLIRFIIESKAHFISYAIGMITNFLLQKRFVFMLKRKVYTAFFLSVSFSIIGLFAGTFLIHSFSRIDFFANHKYYNKLLVTLIIFIYNFYTKRFAFEKEYTKL